MYIIWLPWLPIYISMHAFIDYHVYIIYNMHDIHLYTQKFMQIENVKSILTQGSCETS